MFVNLVVIVVKYCSISVVFQAIEFIFLNFIV